MPKDFSIKVWDLPTRLWHWAIVVLCMISWLTAEAGAMDWHYSSGLAALGLVLFRLVWGFCGGSTARFSHFLRPPVEVLRHLRRPNNLRNSAGHNPLGGYSVVVMLLALIVQIGTGLFAVDVDGIESGPLSHLVSFEQGRTAATVHEISFNILTALVVVHLLAITYYHVCRARRLVMPMLTGRDPQIDPGVEGMTSAGSLRFVLAVVLAAATTWWVGNGLFL